MADMVHPGQALLLRERAKGARLALAHGLLDRFLTRATKSLDPVYMYDERSGVISAVYMNQYLTVPVAVLDATTGAQQGPGGRIRSTARVCMRRE
jgi:hypothetical protein